VGPQIGQSVVEIHVAQDSAALHICPDPQLEKWAGMSLHDILLASSGYQGSSMEERLSQLPVQSTKALSIDTCELGAYPAAPLVTLIRH
jgi:hypothetical protein